MTQIAFSELWSDRRRLSATFIVVLAAVAIGAALMYAVNQTWLSSRALSGANTATAHEEHEHGEGEEATVVTFAKGKWDVAGLRIEQVRRGTLSGTSWATGRLSLNEDRLAHIYSLVDGRVHRVSVQFGDDVTAGQTLAVIDSKEVGAAKLDLYKDRLDAQFAQKNNDWAQQVSINSQELIKTLTARPPLETIGEKFKDKPMGEYRQQLMTAYASLYKSKKDFERLKPLAIQNTIAGKQVLAAKTAYEADRATFQALLEQLKFTVRQQALLAEQKLQQAEQAVAASRSRLFILGYKQADLQNIDPVKEGEAIAHNNILAPFDGTIIGKNVVLAERVGPDTEMFQVADLSSLWVEADIYQKDLSKIARLGDTLHFRSPNSDHDHAAKIFYTGDILDPRTRTVQLRAMVDNPQRLLKAGMFVEVALPGESIIGVLIVPTSALQEVDGQDVVFVQTAEDQFETRHVTIGARSDGTAQIREGLKEGESVVVAGGFTLKSELMKGAISHGH